MDYTDTDRLDAEYEDREAELDWNILNAEEEEVPDDGGLCDAVG